MCGIYKFVNVSIFCDVLLSVLSLHFVLMSGLCLSHIISCEVMCG